MRYRGIFNLLGIVLLLESVFLAISLLVSVLFGEDPLPLLYTFGLTFVAGLCLFLFTGGRGAVEIMHREGFLTVTLSWLFVALFGSLPYIFSGTFETFTDAYFEAMAGFTTTGSSVMTDIEGVPKGILFWRSITQWLGGMGVVLFSLAIMPLIGGGLQLFKAEVPEIMVEKLRPRLIDTAKSLWYIYTTLTVLAMVLYMLGGMDIYNALCHAFTTLATGGFSTLNTSIKGFNSAYIETVATIFMFLAGVNYSLYFYAMRKGEFSRFLRSEEFRFYLWITILAVLTTTISIWGDVYDSLIEALRYASFQVVSLMTTTGYATADYEGWPYLVQALFVVLMFFGGMIGSTGGGIKQVRVLLAFKQVYRELYQLIHPRAVTVIKLDDRHIPKEVLGGIWGFVFLFLSIWVSGTLLLSGTGLDLVTSASAVASAVCNVGPALGLVGPTDNYFGLSPLAKWILVFCMLAGRLEVYTVMVLVVPQFWRR